MTLTNGTDEAIQLVVNTYVSSGDTVVVLRPTYAMYRFYSQVAGARVVEVDYLPDLSFPEQKLLRAVNARTKAIFVANPNNPTGTLASPEQLKALLEAASNAAVMVDEAYFEFCGQTALPWITRYPNLFVSRTFSKAFGLAAMRLRLPVFRCRQYRNDPQGSVSLQREFARRRLRPGSDPGRRLCEEICFRGSSRAAKSCAKSWTAWAGSTFRAMPISCWSISAAPPERCAALLGEHEILVRDRSYELPGCVRITVGTVAQTRRLIGVLRRIAAGTCDARRQHCEMAARRTPLNRPRRVVE